MDNAHGVHWNSSKNRLFFLCWIVCHTRGCSHTAANTDCTISVHSCIFTYIIATILNAAKQKFIVWLHTHTHTNRFTVLMGIIIIVWSCNRHKTVFAKCVLVFLFFNVIDSWFIGRYLLSFIWPKSVPPKAKRKLFKKTPSTCRMTFKGWCNIFYVCLFFNNNKRIAKSQLKLCSISTESSFKINRIILLNEFERRKNCVKMLNLGHFCHSIDQNWFHRSQ